MLLRQSFGGFRPAFASAVALAWRRNLRKTRATMYSPLPQFGRPGPRRQRFGADIFRLASIGQRAKVAVCTTALLLAGAACGDDDAGTNPLLGASGSAELDAGPVRDLPGEGLEPTPDFDLTPRTFPRPSGRVIDPSELFGDAGPRSPGGSADGDSGAPLAPDGGSDASAEAGSG